MSRRPEALQGALGDRGLDRLVTVLREHALAVARAFAGGVAAVRGQEAGPIAGLEGPVIVVTADVPRLAVGHLTVAAADLGAGVDVAFGPTLQGGYYLVAMREPRADVLAAAASAREPGLAGALAVAQQAGLEVGLVRMERALRDAADARALLADPLLPQQVRAVLQSAYEPPPAESGYRAR